MQCVSRFLHAGNGPYEVLMPSAYAVDDTLYVMDIQKSNLFVIPLDKAAEGMPASKWIRQMPYKFHTMRVMTYKGQMLSLNPFWFEDKSIDVSNGEPKLFYSDGELIPYGEDKIFSGNCFQGHLLANPEKGTIVYVESSYPLVEFYDDSLRLVRSITGPDNLKPEYLNDGSYLFYAKIYGYPYGPVCCDDSYIYLRYDDNIDTENPIMTTQMEDGIPTIPDPGIRLERPYAGQLPSRRHDRMLRHHLRRRRHPIRLHQGPGDRAALHPPLQALLRAFS